MLLMFASRSRPRISAASSRVSAKAIWTGPSPDSSPLSTISMARAYGGAGTSWGARCGGGLFRLGPEAKLAPGRGVGDAEVQLRRVGGPGFVDAGLLIERARGGDRADRVRGGFRRDLMKLSFSVASPLPRGHHVVPHGGQHTQLKGFFN